VIGGTAVVVTHDGGSGPSAPAIAATASAGLPGPSEAGGTGSTPAPTAGSLSSTPAGTASGSPTAVPTASGAPTPSGPAPPPSPTAAPTASAPAAGTGSLVAGSPRAQGALRVGSSGDIVVPIRNTGDDESHDLVVTLRLPAGITARGGSGSDSWTCTPGATATCTLDDLDGGDQTSLHVRVEVTAAAVPGGTASGSVRADGTASAPIPTGMLVVLP
jgi:hypothetical protein